MEKHKAQVIPFTIDDVPAVAGIVRQADIDEIEHALGIPMQAALEQCAQSSAKASMIVYQGKVLAVFGDSVHDQAQCIGVPWLISTVHVELHVREFLRVCKPAVMAMLERHAVLLNFVDARNAGAVKWLKWLGFTFADPVPYGRFGMPFYPFRMTREV